MNTRKAFTHRFKLSGLLALLILLLASMGPVSAAQSPEKQPKDLEPIALAIVAARTGLPEDRLAVANSTVAEFPTLGRQAYAFKIIDRESGALYGIDLDDAGQAVDVEQWLTEEKTAGDALHGRVDPELAGLLKDAARDTHIPVVIWLHEDAYTPPTPPSPHGVGSAEAVDAYLARAASLREQAVGRVTLPMVARLKAMGIAARADTVAPMLFAHLTPDQVGQMAAWSEVDTVYLETPAEPTLNIARSVVGADVVQNLGITGDGVKVAEMEVGGRAYLHPALLGIINDNAYSCATNHSTHVAGIIRSTDPVFTGIAPNVLLRVGGSCDGDTSEILERSTRAADWGARVFNLSFGRYTDRLPDYQSLYYDSMVRNRRRSVIVAAGNRGTAGCEQGTNGVVTSPGTAYNVITVGNFDDKNSPSWADDGMDPCSSWKNPVSLNGDREKPEVAAPGANILSTFRFSNGAFGFNNMSGTSMATPMVTGGAALLIQRVPTLATWPEIVKAILMASATHNIEGDSRLSEYDGAGGIVLDRADRIAEGRAGNWGGISYPCSQPANLNLATMRLMAGISTRAVMAWDTDTSLNLFLANLYQYRPSADLDLEVLDPSGNLVAVSNSYDNTYEIVQFTPAVSGDYTLRAVKYRCDGTDAGFLGFAWTRL
jgi:subtilisin family serine protease